MYNDPYTLERYVTFIRALYDKHDGTAEGFLRTILFEAYCNGADSEVDKVIEAKINQLNAFNENLCKKDTARWEKFICEHCEYRPQNEAEVS